jgi:thioredoxin reductase
VDAISLVFGTKNRGVDIPLTNEHFETNQPGVYIVGELGGMGLIRNAVSQGRQAGQDIIAGSRRGKGEALDALVVGAGPAGISTTLQLMEAGLRVLLIEREQFGGTIMHYPRKKIVMTGTLDFPLFGKVKCRTMSKEELVDLWKEIRSATGMSVTTGELVEMIEPSADGQWQVQSSGGQYLAANVVLALGRRGSPRKLGVPGEEEQKVSYRLLEPQGFANKHVLIVGGGNSAAECAIALADFGECQSVTISYRRSEFARCRAQVRERLEAVIAGGHVQALMATKVTEIGTSSVTLVGDDSAPVSIPNDEVIVQIGGTPPDALLGKFGIQTVTKRAQR